MGIKKVKLQYKAIATRRTDEIAYTVPSDVVNAVNRSIERKINRNIGEMTGVEQEAKKFIVRDSNTAKKLELKSTNS